MTFPKKKHYFVFLTTEWSEPQVFCLDGFEMFLLHGSVEVVTGDVSSSSQQTSLQTLASVPVAEIDLEMSMSLCVIMCPYWSILVSWPLIG